MSSYWAGNAQPCMQLLLHGSPDSAAGLQVLHKALRMMQQGLGEQQLPRVKLLVASSLGPVPYAVSNVGSEGDDDMAEHERRCFQLPGLDDDEVISAPY